MRVPAFGRPRLPEEDLSRILVPRSRCRNRLAPGSARARARARVPQSASRLAPHDHAPLKPPPPPSSPLPLPYLPPGPLPTIEGRGDYIVNQSEEIRHWNASHHQIGRCSFRTPHPGLLRGGGRGGEARMGALAINSPREVHFPCLTEFRAATRLVRSTWRIPRG